MFACCAFIPLAAVYRARIMLFPRLPIPRPSSEMARRRGRSSARRRRAAAPRSRASPRSARPSGRRPTRSTAPATRRSPLRVDGVRRRRPAMARNRAPDSRIRSLLGGELDEPELADDARRRCATVPSASMVTVAGAERDRRRSSPSTASPSAVVSTPSARRVKRAVARVALAGRGLDDEEAAAVDGDVEVAPGRGNRAGRKSILRRRRRRRRPPTRARSRSARARRPMVAARSVL